ncbi:conserved hypothetical protein [Arcanobacterium phocae]|uniref:Lysylphosphatidylglycerol synthase TM region n=1 Tax=Arcanobacterium phocae TaxID=131112 RepID=A0A1H2LB90_9ACTO|nr:lysylphosphatidylglycerol synthase transmembrane domain-containing protein [Arcanobacterium phocae]SDU78072.1 conserved hypothetical protein [Arcanobacterium phocae]
MKTATPLSSEPVRDPARKVLLVDAPQRWMRQPADLVGALVAFLAIAGVVVLSMYGRLTVLGVTSDVRAATSSLLEQIFFVPINILEGLVSFFIPLALLIDMLVHRRWRTAVTALVASIATVGLTELSHIIVDHFLKTIPASFTSPLLMFTDPTPYLAVIAALLTIAGGFRGNRLVRWGWILTIFVALLLVLQGKQTLPSAVATALLGVGIALLSRFVIGALPRRITGAEFVDLVRRAGIDPVKIIRHDIDVSDDVAAWSVSSHGAIGYEDTGTIQRITSMWSSSGAVTDYPDPETAQKLERSATMVAAPEMNGPAMAAHVRAAFPAFRPASVSRMYVVTDADGATYQVHVLDEDRLIVSALADLWRQFRLKITYREGARTLGDAAQQHVLMQLAVEKAGISHKLFVGDSHGDSSVCLIYQVPQSVLLDDVDGRIISDDVIDSLWDNLQKAHVRGMSHGDLHAGCVRVDDDGLYIANWQDGSLLASETVRLVDLAQGLAMLAGIVGIDRAVESLTRSVRYERIMALVPLLQKTIMPPRTREDFPKAKDFQQIRQELEDRLPDASAMEPVEIKRFSPKTIITVSIGVIAVYLLAASVNFTELSQAIRAANPMWMILSFLTGLLTYLGAAITLKAYTQEHVPLGQSILVQVAASLVTLVAPAGIGPAALNLRFLQKKNVGTAPAVATVTVVQLAQFITTVISLIALTLITGELGALSMPSSSVMMSIGLAVAAIAAVFLIRPLRAWILTKIQPTVEQIWPRLVWLGTHPRRLAFGFLGSVIMTVAFVACFGFALGAFGYQLPLVTLAVTYLISNSVGSLVPSPGGIGPVEAALTGGLVLAGIPYSVALSTAVLYRLFTFWGRVPLGWIALRIATKRNYI